MSYLNALRLHFAGQFQSNISTVNNDPAHFDTGAFQPNYQQMWDSTMLPPDGWFNPEGDAAFRLRGCRVTSAFTTDGPVGPADPVLSCLVADSDRAAPAKLVDLDPEQQLVSEIWGLEVRIADPAGNTLLRAGFLAAGFLDIWDKATSSGLQGDLTAGAIYQSVLDDLEWADLTSPFLAALHAAAAPTGRLSIKFNVDGINMDYTSPDFLCGRIAGTIGPYLAGEPLHLVVGRQFVAAADPKPPPPSFFRPAGGINSFPAAVDPLRGCVYLDLGNALSTTEPGGPPSNLGDLALGAYDPIATPTDPAGSFEAFVTIPATGEGGYTGGTWYDNTAGVVEVPLTGEQLSLAAQSPLALCGASGVVVAEWPNAAFVRADTFVYRMSPGESITAAVYASQFGHPIAGADIAFALDPSQLQVPAAGGPTRDNPCLAAGPPVGVPPGALRFPATAPTDPTGLSTLTLTAGDPGLPRSFSDSGSAIDGQVYGIRPAFADPAMNAGPVNQWNFVSVLLWSGYTVPEHPTWTDVQPIFAQYANLYPVMLRFLNLADYGQVVANSRLLTLAFSLDIANSNTMPVTRDLSPAKRQAILAWLQDPKPGPAGTLAAAVTESNTQQEGAAGPPAAAKGGKAAAAANRLILQQGGRA